MNKHFSEAMIRRLPKYYQKLKEMEAANIQKVSSFTLGKELGFTASQIRQDLSHFGGFGQQGYGYHVPELKQRIISILAIDKKWKVVIIGAGNVGRALASYPLFQSEGFDIIALFDNDPSVVGRQIVGIDVLSVNSMAEFLKGHKADIAVITVPADAVSSVIEVLKDADISGIWNFAPVILPEIPGVMVENIHITDSLMALTFKLSNIKHS